MRVVIVGGGLAGSSLGQTLADLGHHVTLIDRDPSIAARSFEHGLATIVGDGTEPRILREADVASADVVAAMLRRDADNLAVAAIARAQGAKRILARLRDPDYRRVYADAGIDQVFSEIETMVGALSVAIEHPRVQHSMVLGKGESIAFEINVPPGARVAGQTVRELGTAEGFPHAAVVAGIAPPDGPVVVPRGDARVNEGDAVLLVAKREDVAAAIAFLCARRES
ncbi:MAG: TrkA family potassium uptake protein [Sandaracinaceae bacterium]|nr:TrkA family potassium uptake protein [Sandaracinaceae bacterium]